MNKKRKLVFKNDKLVGSNCGFEIDKQGNKGVWRTNENGNKYFIRVGETIKEAQERYKNEKAQKYNSLVNKYANTESQNKTNSNSRVRKFLFDVYEPKDKADIIKYITEFRNNKHTKSKLLIAKVGIKDKKEIEKITGEPLISDKYILDLNELQHIENRHGKFGKADSSMFDLNAYANIPDVLNNFDNLHLLLLQYDTHLNF